MTERLIILAVCGCLNGKPQPFPVTMLGTICHSCKKEIKSANVS